MADVSADFDPLDLVSRDGVPRDRWDRPLLYPRGVPTRVPYASASSLADYISNLRGIYTWEKRYLARGLGQRPDLAMLAGAETYSTGFEDQDVGENKESGRRLDEIIGRALDHVRLHQKADLGTVGHALTNPGAREAGAVAPDVLAPEVAAWDRAIRGLTIVATEVFIANDHLMAAGTFDHLVRGDDIPASMTHGVDCSGTLVVVDKKFGKLKPGPFSVQTAVYAGGEVYGLGEQMDVRQTFEEKYGLPVNQKVGLIGHIPFGKAKAEFHPVDLVAGREAAEHAAWVRGWQKSNDQLRTPLDTDELARRRAEALLVDISTPEEASAIYNEFADVWTDRLTEVGRKALQR